MFHSQSPEQGDARKSDRERGIEGMKRKRRESRHGRGGMIERQMGLKWMTETKHVKRGGGKGRGKKYVRQRRRRAELGG